MVYRFSAYKKKTLRNVADANRLASCRLLFKKDGFLTLTCVYIYEILLFMKKTYSLFLRNNFNNTYNTKTGNDLLTPSHN